MSDNQKSDSLKTKQQLDRLIQNLSGLIETKLKLFRLDAEQEFSRVLALSLTLMMMFALACIIGLFASIALAIVLGDFLGNFAYGFLSVAGLYSLLLIGVNSMKYSLRDGIQKGVDIQWEKLREKRSEELPETSSNQPKSI